jgi:hypothetical protein
MSKPHSQLFVYNLTGGGTLQAEEPLAIQISIPLSRRKVDRARPAPRDEEWLLIVDFEGQKYFLWSVDWELQPAVATR